MSEFSEYDQENPHIWLLFRATTLMLLRQGFRHYGAKTIMERIRWHTSVEQGERDFKINNNWASFYARKFMEHHPVHEGFFFTRTKKLNPEKGEETHQRVSQG
jgi:hypothetical protein|tara:strand:- start:1219 stop:1527 length:309 start_codon:yes stop_codon:yes gene_type:complete